MKKSMLAISACLALGITACSDRETAPAPVGGTADSRAITPPADTAPSGTSDSGQSVAGVDTESSGNGANMGASGRTDRSATYGSSSVTKSKRTKVYHRNDDRYAGNRNGRGAYTGAGGRTSDIGDGSDVNTGATSASSDSGYTTQSGEPKAASHNPAAINSGF